MINIIKTIKSLSVFSSSEPATKSEIANAEQQLGLSFADEYKKYLAKFGSIITLGLELSGIVEAEYSNVVYLTKREWELNPKVPHTMYAVENTHVDGIIIWQDSAGCIYKSRPHTEPVQIDSSLTNYIIKRTRLPLI